MYLTLLNGDFPVHRCNVYRDPVYFRQNKENRSTLKELSDEKLMALVQRGKLRYMELLFERYSRRLYNYFLRCTMDREESHDLTQNTFVRVMKYRDSFKPDREFRIWLFQIARNLVRDHFRNHTEKTENYDPVDDPYGYGAEEFDAEQLQREERLHLALARLPADRRELLVMSKFQGLKYEEIARIRDVSVGAVKVQVHRTIAQLRKIYFEFEEE